MGTVKLNHKALIKAIEDSIVHWEQGILIKLQQNKEPDPHDGYTCPLCCLVLANHTRRTCKNCPLYRVGAKENNKDEYWCHGAGSFWSRYDAAHSLRDVRFMKSRATLMIYALKNTLAAYKKK